MEARASMPILMKRIVAWIAVVFSLFVAVSSNADPPEMIFQLGRSGYGASVFSPNGAYIATAGYFEHGAALQDAKTGVILTYFSQPLQPPSKPHWINVLAFSPDGRLLALGDASGEVSIWNVRTVTLVRTLQVPGPEGRASSLQFDRTGKQLLASLIFDTGPVVIYNVATGQPISQWYATLRGQRAWTMSAELSADGQRILTVTGLSAVPPSKTDSAALQMHDALTGKILWEKPLTEDAQDYCARFVLNGSRILLAPGESATICDSSDGKTLTSWKLKYGADRLSISPDGKIAAITSILGGGLYSLPDGHLLKTIWDDNELVFAVFGPNGQLMITTEHFPMQILAARTYRPIRTFPVFYRPVIAGFAASPDRQTYAMIVQIPPEGPDGPDSLPQSQLLLFNARTGIVRQQMWLGRIWRVSLSFSPDSRRIVCPSEGGWSLFDVATGALVIKTNITPPEPMRSNGLTMSLGPVQFSADGSSLIESEMDDTGLSNNEIVFRSSATGAVTKTLSLGTQVGSDCYALSPDGKTLAVTATETKDNQFSSEVELWDVAKQQRIEILTPVQETRSNYPTLVFSPDGKTLAVGHLGPYGPRPLSLRKSTLDLYSMLDGNKLATIPDSAEQQIAFSSDSKTLYTASGAIWNVETAQALKPIGKFPNGNLLALAVDSAGQGNILTGTFLNYFRSDPDHPLVFDDDDEMVIRDAKTGRTKAIIQMLPLKKTPKGLLAEWLTTTLDGYYCGSPNASHWISWHRGITLLPTAPLVATYNRPDRVREALKSH